MASEADEEPPEDDGDDDDDFGEDDEEDDMQQDDDSEDDEEEEEEEEENDEDEDDEEDGTEGTQKKEGSLHEGSPSATEGSQRGPHSQQQDGEQPGTPMPGADEDQGGRRIEIPPLAEHLEAEPEGESEKVSHDAATPYSSTTRVPTADFMDVQAGTLQWMFVNTPLAIWLSIESSAGCFRASTSLRTSLSRLISMQLVVVMTLTGKPPQQSPLAVRQNALKVKRRLPQSPLHAALPGRMYVYFAFKDKPLKLGTLVRKLMDLAPMIAWSEATLSFKCRGNADVFEMKLRRSMRAIAHADLDLFIDNPFMMRKVVQVTLNTAEVLQLDAHATFPQVSFLKLICYETDSTKEVLQRAVEAFNVINRLHLVIVPTALPVISGPGFQAPRDFRLSLMKSPLFEQDENIFVTSHLFNLPFSWSGTAFRNVVRLQLHQLHQESFGKSLESLIELLQGLPQLRRLGTLSLRAMELFDILREDCALEELVMLVEVIDTYKLFSQLLPLELWKRRMPLRRLAVHFLCIDGVPRLPADVESAYCAGWLCMSNLLHAGGHISFSVGHPQLQETALLQLPWLLPAHFTFDPVQYRWPDQLPRSTPADRELPCYGLDSIPQPSGILVRGRAKPRSREELEMSGQLGGLGTKGSSTFRGSKLPGLSGSQVLPTLEPPTTLRLTSSLKKATLQAQSEVWTHPAEEWREMSLKEAVDIMRTHCMMYQ